MQSGNDPEQQDLNPSQKDYQEKFNSLAGAEKSIPESSTNDIETASDLQNSESRTDQGQGYYRKTNQQKGFIGGKKKKGPLGLIIGIVFGGGLGFGALFTPALGIVQLKETMVNKMNTQLGSMDARTQRVILSKVNNTTNFTCKIKIKCKFKSMSAKQVARFEKAGFTIESIDEKAFGRKRIQSMSFKDSSGNKTTITADNFKKNYKSNPEIRSATHKAYNPKFGGFSDKVWAKVKGKFGLSERGPKAAATNEERAKNLQDGVKGGMGEDTFKNIQAGDEKPCSPDCPGKDGKVSTDPEQRKKDSKYTASEANEFNEKATSLSDPEAKKVKTSAAISEIEETVSSGASKGVLKSLGNSFKITGLADTACTIYGSVQAVGYGAKTIRAIQLARYAMAFFTVADMIKAGKAKPEDVAFLGTILSSVAIDAKSAVKRKSAFDSFGYKYAAYGETGKMSNYTMQFLAGGGLTGDLINITGRINEVLGGNPRGVCRTLSNPWVMAGSLIGGIALAIFSGGTFTGAQLAGQGLLAGAVIAATIILPKMLSDMIAGNVTEGIVGEDAGDAITSGAGSMMGSTANSGGNSVLTKEQALAYNNLQQETIMAYNLESAKESGPFEVYNPNTFIGSIASRLYFTFGNINNFSGYGSSLLSFVGGSASSLIPKSLAASNAQTKAALDMCKDFDYNSLGIAADPFCNPIFGIPPEYLDADNDDIIDTLKNAGWLVDNSTGDDYENGDPYNKFIENCMNRTNPFGGVNSDNTGSDGKECIITGSDARLKAYAYILQIDNRVEDGMDGYDK